MVRIVKKIHWFHLNGKPLIFPFSHFIVIWYVPAESALWSWYLSTTEPGSTSSLNTPHGTGCSWLISYSLGILTEKIDESWYHWIWEQPVGFIFSGSCGSWEFVYRSLCDPPVGGKKPSWEFSSGSSAVLVHFSYSDSLTILLVAILNWLNWEFLEFCNDSPSPT